MRAAQENSRDVDQLDSVNAIASSFKHVATADPKKIDMTLQLQSMSATGLAERLSMPAVVPRASSASRTRP